MVTVGSKTFADRQRLLSYGQPVDPNKQDWRGAALAPSRVVTSRVATYYEPGAPGVNWLGWGAALVGVGVLGYFGWRAYSGRKG